MAVGICQTDSEVKIEGRGPSPQSFRTILSPQSVDVPHRPPASWPLPLLAQPPLEACLPATGVQRAFEVVFSWNQL